MEEVDGDYGLLGGAGTGGDLSVAMARLMNLSSAEREEKLDWKIWCWEFMDLISCDRKSKLASRHSRRSSVLQRMAAAMVERRWE